jgi:hypothetical protein
MPETDAVAGGPPATYWPGITPWTGTHYEECIFDPIYRFPGSFPDWKFSLLTYDRPGGQLLCEFHLELDLNPAAQHYILNHPRWKKDMRPLILWVIREILLNVKIVDAEYGVEEKKSCGLEDAKRGVVFEGRLWTKKHVEQEDVTWIHVCNYANTHIRDSLDQIFAKSPGSVPTGDDIRQTRQFFRDQHEQQQAERARRQEAARITRRLGTQSLSIFVDESGDTGFKAGGIYVSTAVCIPTEEVGKVRAALRHVLELCWFRQNLPPELHFAKMGSAKQDRVARLMAKIVRRLNCRVLTYIIPKQPFLRRLSRSEAEFHRERAEPIHIHWNDLLVSNKTAASNWLLSYLLDETISHIVIANLDDLAEVRIIHDRKLYPWQTQAMEQGAVLARQTVEGYVREFYGDDTAPLIHMEHQASELEPCLWLADWIGWEIQRSLRDGGVSPNLVAVFPKTTSLVIDTEGVKAEVDLQTEKRLHTFPDLPRDISAP